jgi:hypothetical protein
MAKAAVADGVVVSVKEVVCGDLHAAAFRTAAALVPAV